MKANSKNNVNIFTGNISPVQPTKQVAERDVVKQVKSGAITQDSSSETESSSDEKQSRKRKKQKRRKKEKRRRNILDRYHGENSYGVERFPFCLPQDTILPNCYPIYRMPHMPSEYQVQGGAPFTGLQGRRNKGGRRGNRPPCPSAGGARGAKVPFQFITVNLINLLLI